MKSQNKIRRLIGVIGVGVLLFTGVHVSDATEIKFLKIIYDKSIAREGREIIHLALLDSSKARTQEAIGKVIVNEASAGRMNEKAAVAYGAVGGMLLSNIDQQRGQAILRISKAKARTADIVAREEGILGPAAIQKRIQVMNLAKAQRALIDAEDLRIARKIEAKDRQAEFVRRLVKGAQVNWAAGEMGKAVFASVQGGAASPIPSNAVHIIQSSMGFGALDDFRLSMALLENETGQPLTQLLPAPVSVAFSGSAGNVSRGWGGFAEFGFFAVAGFVFMMWTSAWTAMRDTRPPVEGEEEEEAKYPEYKKAA